MTFEGVCPATVLLSGSCWIDTLTELCENLIKENPHLSIKFKYIFCSGVLSAFYAIKLDESAMVVTLQAIATS